MRFTCEKSMLVQAINIASRTVAQKSSLSVIEGILCRAGHVLSLTGYNMETAITYEIAAEVSDPGVCILPAKLFADIIRRLPEGTSPWWWTRPTRSPSGPASPPSPSPPKMPTITPSCPTWARAGASASPRTP